MAATQDAGMTGLRAAGPGDGVWPGLFNPNDPAGAMLFDAADGTLGDPVTNFYARDLPAMDWLVDFLLDDSLLELRIEEGPSFKVEEDPDSDNRYDKNAIVTTDTDLGWAS